MARMPKPKPGFDAKWLAEHGGDQVTVCKYQETLMEGLSELYRAGRQIEEGDLDGVLDTLCHVRSNLRAGMNVGEALYQRGYRDGMMKAEPLKLAS